MNQMSQLTRIVLSPDDESDYETTNRNMTVVQVIMYTLPNTI